MIILIQSASYFSRDKRDLMAVEQLLDTSLLSYLQII